MRPRRRERGMALVFALAILAGMVALVASVAASQRLALRAEENRINGERARVVAMAGVQRAIASLADTIQGSATTSSTTASSTTPGQAQMQADEWYALGDKGNDRFIVGAASFRMQIVDAASMVNLNTAPETELDQLPLTTEQVASLLDWREAGATPRTEGAKDEYYNALTKPYNTKLRRLDSVDELLDIRYFTPNDVFQITQNSTSAVALPTLADGRQAVLADLVTTDSHSPQLRPDGTAMIGVGQGSGNVQQRLQQLFGASAARIARGAPYTTLGAVFANTDASNYGNVLDYLTVANGTTAEGKMNLNTVTEAALMTLPNMTEDLAQGIVNYQATGFTKPSDLLQVSGFTDANNLRQFAGYFTVRSSVFLVHVVGESGGSQIALEAVVDTSSGAPRLVKMYDQPYADMPTRWGWSDDTTNDITLVDDK